MPIPITIDYMTLTSHGDTRIHVTPPPGASDMKQMHWQAGPALYEGMSYAYDDGSMQALHSPEQGTLIRLSGNLCERLFPNIDLEWYRLTRLDLCMTVPTTIDLDYWYARQREQGVKVKCSLINSETLYVGSRKSDRFWRTYNKAIEQGIAGDLFRIEIELKGLRARQARGLLQQGKRLEIFMANRIGIMPELINQAVWKQEELSCELPDIALPRKTPHGKRFLKQVVIPFLRSNAWAIDELREEGIFNYE